VRAVESNMNEHIGRGLQSVAGEGEAA
jgi:hypothetical protein